MDFRERWLESVVRKGSVLCAGLDPAEFEMHRGEDGLPEGVRKEDWALSYLEAVAPFCAAIKPNLQYWKGIGDARTLASIDSLTHDLGLVVIDDSKLADIGSTNDAGIYYASRRADAVTFSPFAGNVEEAVKQAHSREIGLVSMVLMSNPEFAWVKDMGVEVLLDQREGYPDLGPSSSAGHLPYYMKLAHDARKYGVDGIVIGAPSAKNHIQEHEISYVRDIVGPEMLVLLPGVGRQGGEAGAIWKYFGNTKVIANVGRAVMFPNGSRSTPKEQAKAARVYRDMLNELRGP